MKSIDYINEEIKKDNELLDCLDDSMAEINKEEIKISYFVLDESVAVYYDTDDLETT